MENEVSSISKLGIVLIALAVLIALGFGIFQISKSTANDGVGDVQTELDGVNASTFTTYDQTTITGNMARSALKDFEGENIAVMIATQAFTDLLPATDGTDGAELDANGSGFNTAYTEADKYSTGTVPLVNLNGADSNPYKFMNSEGDEVEAQVINYGAILGTPNSSPVEMTTLQFDNDCFRVSDGFATDTSGKVVFNRITGNTAKSGKTEFIPSGAKFESYLIKDKSGTIMGVIFMQVVEN